MISYNLHQHTLFSDGKDKPEKYVEKALEQGFTALGFSEHSPLPFDTSFSLKEEQIDEYILTINKLKEKYHNRLAIYRALEMDYIPGFSEDFGLWQKKCQTDYLIGSVHLVRPEDTDELWFTDGPDYRVYDKGIEDFFGGNIRKAVKAFYHQSNQMIETQQFDIIGHFDKITMHNRNRFFTDEEKWYRDLVNETVELIKQKNLIVEINTRGIYKKRSDTFFPDGYALRQVKMKNIPILISSDAHQAAEISMLFDDARQYLTDLGFYDVMYFENRHWKPIPLEEVSF